MRDARKEFIAQFTDVLVLTHGRRRQKAGTGLHTRLAALTAAVDAATIGMLVTLARTELAAEHESC